MQSKSSNNSIVRKTDYQIGIVNKIKQLRIEKGLTQFDMTKLLGVSNGQIGNIESYRQPHKYTLSQLKKICDTFDISITELFTGSKQQISCENLINILIEYEKSR